MRSVYLSPIVFLFTLLISTQSFALAKMGHKIVCQLAFEQLSSTKQNQITTLLSGIPNTHQELINRYNHQKKGRTISFANACTWADAVKRLDSYKRYNRWHYMNVPRTQKEVKPGLCAKNCLPQAILVHQQILVKNKESTPWQQAQALLFLGHWLGDIHQPLHISFNDDLGGNKVTLSNKNTKCDNLHRYWDECILSRGKHSQTKWLTLLREKWLLQSQPKWQVEQVWQWADESFQFVTEARFNYCQLTTQGVCQKIKGEIKLPPNYQTQYQAVMEQRLLQAAQRLTHILNASL